jgi:3-oxoacyl-[acyl-carrier-protein] synthase-3
MARALLKHVRIAGLTSCVPATVADNLNCKPEDLQARERLVRNIGIKTRRVCAPGQVFSDLAQKAVEDLIAGLGWQRDEIDAFVCVTQSPDYPIPATSIVMQDRLGLSKSTLAFDVNLGCSGYPYGLFIVGSMLSAGKLRRAVVVIGDQSAVLETEDQGHLVLFGDAATATALEYDEAAPDIHFDGYSDGSGYKAIMIPHGGKKHPLTMGSFDRKAGPDGVVRAGVEVILDGPAILNFSTAVAPVALRDICEFAGVPIEQIDYFVLHQANRIINETIRKKLRLPEEKFPGTLSDFGNTSSASIPVTITARTREDFSRPGKTFVLCGFGIGLSWATMLVRTTECFCPPMIEL